MVVSGVVAIIVMLYAASWFYLASATREAVMQWVEDRRDEGFQIRFNAVRASGFPTRIHIEAANPSIGVSKGLYPWGWETDRLALVFTPWNMTSPELVSTGGQVLSFMQNNRRRTFSGVVDEVRALMALKETGSTQYSAESVALTLKGLQLKDESGTSMALDHLQMRVSTDSGADTEAPDSTVDLDISASNVSLPLDLATPLGQDVGILALSGSVMGNLHGGNLKITLENWRDGGGTIEITKFRMDNGPLSLRGDGTLALDGDLQPIGAFTTKVQGFLETIDVLQERQLIKPGDALKAKLVLGILAKRPAGERKSTLSLALTLQDRTFYAGPVALMKYPPIDWKDINLSLHP